MTIEGHKQQMVNEKIKYEAREIEYKSQRQADLDNFRTSKAEIIKDFKMELRVREKIVSRL